jgi:UDP-N-acetylmuramoyl-tripeptide--D-alanyl-D-alanine ligase
MRDAKIDFVLGVRGLAKFIVEGAAENHVPGEFVNSPEEAAEWLRGNIRPGDVVLFKASRGVRLERALESWMGDAAKGSH